VKSSVTPSCSNNLCTTTGSPVYSTQIGPDGTILCKACYDRYRKTPNEWQQTRAALKKLRTCENTLCSTPNQPVSPVKRGPDGKLLCEGCYQRHKRQLKRPLPRAPDSWKTATGGRSRKGIKMPNHTQTKPSGLPTSDSDDDEPLPNKRDESRRGMKIQARVPDKMRCQMCFDYALNCDKGDKEKYTQCTERKRICRPLQLNADGTLPATRRFAQVQVQQDDELKWEERCYKCRKHSARCDAAQPINPKQPCTRCRDKHSYCCSMEQAQLMKDQPKCLRCSNAGKRCDKGNPCDICIDDSHARCTYETDHGIRWLTTLTNPIKPDQRTSRTDANVDYYNADNRPGCQLC